MSDTSQGPNWWQASDGKWYPPESRPGAVAPPPPQYAAPPPAKKGRGCLIGSLAGIGGLVLLGVIVLVVIIAVVAANSGDDNKKSGVRTLEGTKENPAIDDVKLIACTPPAAGETTLPSAKANGEITNRSSKRSTYSFQVSFEDSSGRRLASGAVFENDLEPGQTAVWDTIGLMQSPLQDVKCKVIEVNRFAS